MKNVSHYRMIKFLLKSNQTQGDAMNTATVHQMPISAKSIVNDMSSKNELPFAEMLPVDQLNNHSGKVPYRNRIFTPILTLFGFLSQAIGADKSCQAAVSQIIAHQISQGKEPPSANTAAYSNARSRLPEEVLSGLAKESGQELEKQAEPEWQWRGKHVKLVDGSTLSMPDTPENQKAYPQT